MAKPPPTKPTRAQRNMNSRPLTRSRSGASLAAARSAYEKKLDEAVAQKLASLRDDFYAREKQRQGRAA